MRWELSQGKPHEFILSKMGEHVELSDWLVGHITRENEGTYYFESATEVLEKTLDSRLKHEVTMITWKTKHEMSHQMELPDERIIEVLVKPPYWLELLQ